MRVYTTFFVMILTPRAPGSFEVEDIKVRVTWLHLVQQIHCDLIFTVSEGAQLTVLTVFHVFGVRLAEFAFVLLRMVKLFDTIVRFQT